MKTPMERVDKESKWTETGETVSAYFARQLAEELTESKAARRELLGVVKDMILGYAGARAKARAVIAKEEGR